VIENWIELIVGALVLVSPWIFGFADISLARWLNVLCGTVLVVVNAWMIYGNNPTTVEEAPAVAQKTKAKRTRRVMVIDEIPIVKNKKRKIKKVEPSLINS
jgi:hypothetical protein